MGDKKIKYIIRKGKKRDLSKSCVLGFENSLFDNILVMDGDLQHDPKDINILIEIFHLKKADIVVGSRNLFHRKNEGLSIIRLTALIHLVTSIKSKYLQIHNFIFKLSCSILYYTQSFQYFIENVIAKVNFIITKLYNTFFKIFEDLLLVKLTFFSQL